MFSPKFSITNKTLNNLIRSELDLNYLKLVEVQAEWSQRLKMESLSKRLIFSLRFDGFELPAEFVNKLILDDPNRDEKPEEIANRLEFSVKERDLQMVLNWINSSKLVDQISYISSKFAHEDITERELKQINRIISERMVPIERLGVYREKNSLESDMLVHPNANEVLYQMEDFFMWFKSAGKEKIHPLIKAVIVFYELVRIKPFENFNLQTSLLFFQACLGSFGYKLLYCYFEEELYKTKEKMFETLADVEKNNGDTTAVLELFTGVISNTLEKTKIRVSNIEGSTVKYKTSVGRAVALSERQVAIMEEITVQNQMTIKEVRQVVPLVSDDTILRDLKDLVLKKMIRKRGRTKGAVYVLGKVKSFQ